MDSNLVFTPTAVQPVWLTNERTKAALPPQATRSDWRVHRVISLIKSNLHKELPLNELARSVNLSPSRLRHMFKDRTGTTPTQYLKSLRMQKAEHLLKTTSLSIKEVMFAVGVNSPSHFVKDFKKAYGCSPARYRATCLAARHFSEAVSAHPHAHHGFSSILTASGDC